MSGYGLAAGAVVSALGAGTTMYANNQNQKNQQQQLAASNATQANIEREGAARVAATTAKTAAASPGAGAQDLLASYKAALSAANPQQSGAISNVSGGSKRYAESAASAKANVNDYATTMAKNLATTGGAQLQRIGTGQDIANTASDLGLISGQSNNESGVLKAQLAGDQANPWLTALGSVAQGAGSGLMGSSLSKGLGGFTTKVAPGLIAGGSDVPAPNFGSMGGSNPYLNA